MSDLLKCDDILLGREVLVPTHRMANGGLRLGLDISSLAPDAAEPNHSPSALEVVSASGLAVLDYPISCLCVRSPDRVIVQGSLEGSMWIEEEPVECFSRCTDGLYRNEF